MNYELRTKKGLTLTEMTVVVATVAMLTALSMPAVRSFFYSMAAASDTKALISASLASARAIAAKEQRYAGIRFQKAYYAGDILDAPQYMIFIVYEEPRKMGNLTIAFRAVEGIQPIKLSDSVGVMDLYANGVRIAANPDIDDPNELRDTTSFSIIFSPSGRLVIHEVRVRNRDGERDSTSNNGNTSNDDIFNKKAQVDSGIGMFYQDDYCGGSLNIYPNLGLWEEPSRNSFVIYEKDKFKAAYQKKLAFSDYLYRLVPEMIRINPYTGTIINEK